MAKTKIKRKIRCGRWNKVVIYTRRTRWDTPRQRAARTKATSKAQDAVNWRGCAERLEAILYGNFEKNALFVTLTFDDAHLPDGERAALAALRSYVTKLRRQRKRLDQELKYTYVYEDKHGAGRPHFHMVMNATGHDYETIRSLWQYGTDIEIVPVEKFSCEYGSDLTALARYMLKERHESRAKNHHAYNTSKNLIFPVSETEYVEDDADIAPPPGCFVMEQDSAFEDGGRGYFHYLKYLDPPGW